LKMNTRCDLNGGRKREGRTLKSVLEGVGVDFFGQLWVCPKKPKSSPTTATNHALVWV
jgi:hypothetical protein